MKDLREEIMNFIRDKNPIGTFPPVYITLGQIRANFKQFTAAELLQEIRTLKFVDLLYWTPGVGEDFNGWGMFVMATRLGLTT